jgi:Trk K+ transport system NAD-binding subunit
LGSSKIGACRTLKPGIRVVMRMFDKQIAEKIARGFDIKLIFSPSAIAAPSFAGATIDRALINSFYIDDKQLQTVKFTIGRNSQLIGKPLGSLQEQHRLRILSHRRHNQEAVLFPPDETMLQENDRIAILAQSAVIGHLHTLNQDQPK